MPLFLAAQALIFSENRHDTGRPGILNEKTHRILGSALEPHQEKEGAYPQKRAPLYGTRKKGKSILLFLPLFFIIVPVLLALAVSSGARRTREVLPLMEEAVYFR